jgi:hypothetical protein
MTWEEENKNSCNYDCIMCQRWCDNCGECVNFCECYVSNKGQAIKEEVKINNEIIRNQSN